MALRNLKDKTLLRRLAVAADSIGQWQRLIEDAATTAYRCKTPSCDMGVAHHLDLVAEYARYLREDMAEFDRLLEELKRRRLAPQCYDRSQVTQ